MVHILMLSDTADEAAEVLPSLELLTHRISAQPAAIKAEAVRALEADVVLLDARQALVTAKNTAQLLRAAGVHLPLIAVVGEGGLAAVSAHWSITDFILSTAGPAELDARLRFAGERTEDEPEREAVIRSGAVSIDEASYVARVNGNPLNLTFKEFELLKFLAQNSGRVFTRVQLLSEVWGYDYYGGTRTVDVHIRRLRAKLGNDHEQLITTVRNVGYSFAAGSS
ncbi:response regulator transcription factor [Rothia sp. AR01]|uniref:Response regulator transcription factor n=1 Tax=Rothia santali TaxID=2949643 RepID=A0A9X2HDA5_9MICC|nr:response regulator transcription factor [Rothia santali]MCP3424757.1 response regulator transcription factor [Rothia santali]